MALAGIDPQLCRKLVDRILSARRGEGLLTANAAGGTASRTVAAWPLWACVAESLQQQFPDPEWNCRARPLLMRTFFAAMAYFDPGEYGLPHWRSRYEAWDRDSYRTNLATPELTVLLLLEIDALRRMCRQPPATEPDTALLEAREQLVTGLLEYMADSEQDCFVARRLGGGQEPTSPRLALFPLLWPGLPGNWVGRLLFHAQSILVPALAEVRDQAWIAERWLWRGTLMRLDADGLLEELDGYLSLPASSSPPESPDSMEKAAYHWLCRLGASEGVDGVCRARLTSCDGLSLVAAVCLTLAGALWMVGREPLMDASELRLLQQHALAPEVMQVSERNRKIEEGFPKAGVLPAFLDWHRIRQAEQRDQWEEAAFLYRRVMQQEGHTPPILFGIARATGRLGRMDEAREYWQMFLDSHADDFPVAARAAREEWWRQELLWAGKPP